jgi:hypothetical protein
VNMLALTSSLSIVQEPHTAVCPCWAGSIGLQSIVTMRFDKKCTVSAAAAAAATAATCSHPPHLHHSCGQPAGEWRPGTKLQLRHQRGGSCTRCALHWLCMGFGVGQGWDGLRV